MVFNRELDDVDVIEEYDEATTDPDQIPTYAFMFASGYNLTYSEWEHIESDLYEYFLTLDEIDSIGITSFIGAYDPLLSGTHDITETDVENGLTHLTEVIDKYNDRLEDDDQELLVGMLQDIINTYGATDATKAFNKYLLSNIRKSEVPGNPPIEYT